MNILVADDFEGNRNLLRAIFSRDGFVVFEATDGVEALQVLQREKIDAAISDILMPNMDGYRLCTEIRRSDRFRDLPFVFYTSTYTSPSDEKLALELGADVFIRRPASPSALVGAVRELISGPPRTHRADVSLPSELDLTKEYTQRLVAKLEEKNEELHRRTQQLRETSDKLQAVISAAPVAIVSFDHDGNVTTWNPAAERIFGWSEREVVGRSPPHLVADAPAEFEALRRRVLAGETIAGIEVRGRRRDGTTVHIELAEAPLRNAEGRIVGKMAVLADITDQKKAEEVAIKSRDFYKALFDEFPTLIWQSGTDAKRNYCNRTWLAFTGRTLEQELGDGWTQSVHPNDVVRVTMHYLEAFNSRAPFELEYRLRRYDGEYRLVIDHGRPFHELDGGFAGYVGSSYDITERKRAQEALRESEERFRIALKTAPVVVSNQDRDLRYTWIYNPSRGYFGGELLGKTDADLFASEEAARLTAIKQKVIESGIGIREEVELTSGEVRNVYDLTADALREPDGRISGVTCVAVDITPFAPLRGRCLEVSIAYSQRVSL